MVPPALASHYTITKISSTISALPAPTLVSAAMLQTSLTVLPAMPPIIGILMVLTHALVYLDTMIMEAGHVLFATSPVLLVQLAIAITVSPAQVLPLLLEILLPINAIVLQAIFIQAQSSVANVTTHVKLAKLLKPTAAHVSPLTKGQSAQSLPQT